MNAQDSEESESPANAVALESSTKPFDIRLGFQGLWRLGQPYAVEVDAGPELLAQVQRLEIVTTDGDGVEVVYKRPVTNEGMRCQVKTGRLKASMTVRLIGAEGEVISEATWQADELPEALPSNQPVIVGLGSTMGAEKLSRSLADGNVSLSSTVFENAKSLPTTWSEYEACDVVIISASSKQLLEAVSEPQWAALEAWVERGGHVVIGLGVERVEKDSGLASFLPDLPQALTKVNNPAAIETLVATKQPLKPFQVSLVQEEGLANVELLLTDVLSQQVPFWIDYVYGKGTVRVVTADLETEAFAQWQDRNALWVQLLRDYFDASLFDTSLQKKGGEETATSFLGYDDVVGQLRTMLDVFPRVTVLSFGQVTAILIVILLLVGPLDYFICVRWLKRPELSWTIAGLMLVASAIGLTLFYEAIRPDEVLINQVQVLDVDAVSGNATGRMWAHVYSGRANRFDVQAEASNASDAKELGLELDWQGLPGSGLGGLRSQLNADRGMPRYVIGSEQNGSASFEGVGIPAAGSKALAGTWHAQLKFDSTSTLQQTSGVDQLQGELVNPLPYELKEPVLFYHGWFYKLNSRLRPGEAIQISFDMIPKDMSRRLNGRVQRAEGMDTSKRWDPANRDQLARLLELMMFYRAANGQNYMSLENRYQPHLDQSGLVDLDRAVLLGRYEGPSLVNIRVNEHQTEQTVSKTDDETNGINATWVRLVIPVAPKN